MFKINTEIFFVSGSMSGSVIPTLKLNNSADMKMSFFILLFIADL